MNDKRDVSMKIERGERSTNTNIDGTNGLGLHQVSRDRPQNGVLRW